MCVWGGGGGGSEGTDDPPPFFAAPPPKKKVGGGANFIHFLCKVLGKRSMQKITFLKDSI